MILINTYKKENFSYLKDTFNYQSALFAANLSNLAYYIGTPQQNIIQQFMNTNNLHFNPVTNLYTYLDTDIAFLWATDPKNKSLYFSFRGTLLNEENIKVDLYQTLVPFVSVINTDVYVSKGFLQAWLAIRPVVMDIIDKNRHCNIFITGHSLGAALASLASFDIKYTQNHNNIISYTFASPRVGDINFSLIYNRLVPDTYRIQNIFDPIPRFPLEIQGYHHIKNEVLITPGSDMSEYDSPECSINIKAPDNYPYDPLEHEILQYMTIIQDLIKDGIECQIYE